MLVGWGDATTSLGVAGADVFAVRFAPERRHGSGRPAQRGRRSWRSRSSRSTGSRAPISDALGRIFGLFDALAAVAVLIAALGIVNTLTMNVIERVREIGILRAAGMTRRQVWRSVVVEAGVLGLAGALLGIVLGLVVGGLMVILAGGRIDVASRACPGRSSVSRSSSASSWRCSPRPIRPVSRAGCPSSGPSSTSDADARLGGRRSPLDVTPDRSPR